MAKEESKAEESPISTESLQAEIQAFVQDKLNDSSVTPADLQRLLQLLNKMTKLIPAA